MRASRSALLLAVSALAAARSTALAVGMPPTSFSSSGPSIRCLESVSADIAYGPRLETDRRMAATSLRPSGSANLRLRSAARASAPTAPKALTASFA